MNSLMQRLRKAGSIGAAEIISESGFFLKKDIIPTDLPILNVAFSGELDGGLVPGLTVFAGLSKSYKTMLSLFCMKAYFDKYPDSIAILYDSEFGVTPDYLRSLGIDTNRVLHIPIEHVEQLKFDMVKRLEEIKLGDKVFFMIDSIGNLPSKKEVEDAMDEKSVADMTRAKAIRSFLRIITTHLTTKMIPCIVINHIYQTMELYSKAVVSGGTAVMYTANQVFIISRSQEKEDGAIAGWNFTINIEKSRFVKEKSKLSFLVRYEDGIDKHSGLFDLAKEFGFILQHGGWYQLFDLETGELNEKKIRLDDIEESYYNKLVTLPAFKEQVSKKYKLSSAVAAVEEEIEE